MKQEACHIWRLQCRQESLRCVVDSIILIFSANMVGAREPWRFHSVPFDVARTDSKTRNREGRALVESNELRTVHVHGRTHGRVVLDNTPTQRTPHSVVAERSVRREIITVETLQQHRAPPVLLRVLRSLAWSTQCTPDV